MHQSRFDNILNSQSSVAQKIFNCIPVGIAWTLQVIYFEVKRRQITTANRSVVEKCLHELTEAGLLKEGPKGTFQRIHPHRQQAQVIKREPVVHPRKVDVPKAPSVSLTPPAQSVAKVEPHVNEPVSVPVTDRNLAANGISTREQLGLESSETKPPTAVTIVATAPAVETVVASTELQSEKAEEAPPKVEDHQINETVNDQGEEAVDHAPLMPIAYHERYMELRLEHGVTMLRELAFLVDSPISQTMLELALDFDRLKQLVRRVPALERQPVTPIDNPHKEPTVFSVKPSDQTELKQAITACEARAKEPIRSKTPEYKTWMNVRYRQGIKIDPRWLKFDEFFKDVGYRPKESARLLRLDPSKGFNKDNMRWKVGGKVVDFTHVKPEGWPWNI